MLEDCAPKETLAPPPPHQSTDSESQDNNRN
jgi:hypothetical protein